LPKDLFIESRREVSVRECGEFLSFLSLYFQIIKNNYMVKKVIEDVVMIKKDPATFFKSVPDKEKDNEKEVKRELPPTSVSKDSSAVNEFRKGMNHIEEILPETESEEQEEKDETMERSPIFEKMKQRHEERESFSEEYAADQEGAIRGYLAKGSLILLFLAAVGAVVWSTVFYSAHVTLHLKHAKVTLNNQEFQAATGVLGVIPSQIMTLSGEDTVKLTATGEQRVTKKASGKIVIYNNFNTQPQVLVKSTRFETPDGKIYRIDARVVVPGMKKVEGKDVPGSVEVTVFADEAGPEYNIGLVDFTIPGFKGSPRYQKFYGRSKTVMTGGASGLVKTISDADVETARTALTKTLKEKLYADAKAKKPNGTVLYPDAVFFTFTDTINDSVQSTEKDVPFTLKGTLEAVLFNEDELSRRIVKTTGEVTEDEKININNIESLAFMWKTPRSSVPEKSEPLDFRLSGSASAVWKLDTSAFRRALAGTSLTDYPRISAKFPGIEKTSEKKISPFWRHTFPEKIEKIEVETVTD